MAFPLHSAHHNFSLHGYDSSSPLPKLTKNPKPLTRQEQRQQRAFYSKLQQQLRQEVRKPGHVTREAAELLQTTVTLLT